MSQWKEKSYSVTGTGIGGETGQVLRNVGIAIFYTKIKEQTRSIQTLSFANSTCYALKVT